MLRIVAISLLALAAPLSLPANAAEKTPSAADSQHRTWLVEVGKRAITAEFIRIEKGRVVLRRREGDIVDVPFGHLSKYDQKYVLQQSPPIIVMQPPDTQPAATFDEKLEGSTAHIPIICQPNTDLGLTLSGQFCLRTVMAVKPEGGEAITARLTSEPREKEQTQLLLAPVVVAGHRLGGVYVVNVYLIDAADRGKKDAAPISNVLKVPVDFGD